MKTKFKLIIFALCLVQVSCNEYLDVNSSPNNPTADNVPANLILAGAQANNHRIQARNMNRLGAAFMNMWGPNINAFTGGFAEEFSLAISNTFYDEVWDSIYINTYDFQAMINDGSDTYDNHKAIAKIMKSFYMQYIVDIWGDAPYTEAHQRGSNLTPAYDDDAFIYTELLREVDEAIVMLNNGIGETVGTEDIIYGGDLAAWETFANTLKLRLLVRASAATDIAAEVNAGFASINTASFISANATINPGYSDGEAAQQNPFYALYGFDTSGTATGFNFYRASAYAIDFFDGAIHPVIDAARRNALYAPNTSGNYVGIIQGSEDNGSVDLSELGPGVIVDSSQDGYIMTAAESYFLQAEAMMKGLISGGDGGAKAAFESGIQASFTLLGAGDASGYITSANGVAKMGWTGSNDEKLEAIMNQKWVAMNGTTAIESWIEFTRTGYPANIPLPTSAIFPTLPNRLMYPNSELIGNSGNVPSLSQAEAFSTKIFWDN